MEQPAWSDSDEQPPHQTSGASSLRGSFADKVSLSTDDDDDAAPMIVHAEVLEFVAMADDAEHKEADSSDDFSGDDAGQACQRYFLEKSGPKCFNCNQPGHMSRDCTAASTLPCFLCGRIGHQRYACPEDLCHNCQRPGHQSRLCKQPRKRRAAYNERCSKCSWTGHQARECPLHWRQYAFVADALKSRAKVEHALEGVARVCYNCAGLEHWGDECPHQRKRIEWGAFNEPDLEFLRLAEVSSGRGRAERDPHHDTGRDHPEASRDREQGRSHDPRDKRAVREVDPNWRRLQGSSSAKSAHPPPAQSRQKQRMPYDQRNTAVTEENYYRHFDGSYSGVSTRAPHKDHRAGDEAATSGTAAGGSKPSGQKRKHPARPAAKGGYKGGYKPASKN